ncbi:granulin a isoform X1 [Brachyistius frenatus]|uniref:granulin a isoform X1 n=1 Tax=Brachyistius frenatus TaxID=100188 RepID=UPI0037E8A869
MHGSVLICWTLLVLVGADECPDGGGCEEGQTCCNDPTDSYECCPFDQAECCKDHIHCCPTDTVCDSSTSGCVNATVSVPWRKRVSADRPGLSKSFRMIKTYTAEEDDNICPDQSRCPAEFSCLKASKGFGCCPVSQGVACSDGNHCCPEAHRCSADGRSCIKNDLVTTVLCGDRLSECPGDTTCCETPKGTWGCCPMPRAVCCSDNMHCCPEGTTCDVLHFKCTSLSTGDEMPMWAKLPARIREEWENQKVHNAGTEKVPEGTTDNLLPPSGREVSVSSVTKAAKGNPVSCNKNTACPDGTTCCKTQKGGWSCCPLPESVPGNDVQCDKTAACADGTTCCKTQEGGWACCPLPEAVCCEDFVHCCPKGKKCNVAAGTCDDGLFSQTWVEKVPAIPRQSVPGNDVQCDKTAACADGTTCCKTQEGGWACCPLPEAVCCEDFVHCCPKGKKCNVAAGTCDDGLFSQTWVEKVPAIPRQSVPGNDVQCDKTAACADGTTCCKTQEGGWACCPLPEAVCCEDFVHCCPKGKKCNVAAGTCDDGLFSQTWVEKVPAIPRQSVPGNDVQCDKTAACADGTTCCKTQEGGWACCPLPEAVCCEDFVHCCPKGKKCNVAAGTCNDGLFSQTWVEKVPAIPRQSVPGNDVQCDKTAACADGTTCCKTQEGGWACCPLPEAVCCEDFIHCCPKGKKCNVAAGTCDDGLFSQTWVEKVPAIPRQSVPGNDVQCDKTAACADGTTCCKTQEGGWACCPLPQAVCCDDHEHCCPAGTTCNPTSTSCDHASGSTPMKRKTPAFLTSTKQREEEKPEEDKVMKTQEEDDEEQGSNKCDAETSCPQHTTCCFMTSSHRWGCCPLPDAVCCADGRHCCPAHYRCDESRTSCVKGDVEVPWYAKRPADPRSVHCDDGSQCPVDSTCCRLLTREWGCCPLKNAVCCADMKRCCPSGHTCTAAGSCTENAGPSWHDWRFLSGDKTKKSAPVL